MEEVLKVAVSQVPALVVVALIIFFVLKFMNQQSGFIRQLHDEHMSARHESRIAMEKLATALNDLTQSITKGDHNAS